MSDVEQDGTVQTDDSPDTQDNVDWQKRFTDTQAEYTKNQQALKEAEKVWEDREALIAKIAELHPDMIAEDETDDEDDVDSSYDDDEPEYMTKAEFQAAEAEKEAKAQVKAAQDQFETDFKGFVGDYELPPIVEQGLRAGSYKGPEELEAAVNAAVEYLDSLGGTKRKKRPTTPLTGGKTSTGIPDYSDMTRDQRDEAMAARARSLEAQ